MRGKRLTCLLFVFLWAHVHPVRSCAELPSQPNRLCSLYFSFVSSLKPINWRLHRLGKPLGLSFVESAGARKKLGSLQYEEVLDLLLRIDADPNLLSPVIQKMTSQGVTAESALEGWVPGVTSVLSAGQYEYVKSVVSDLLLRKSFEGGEISSNQFRFALHSKLFDTIYEGNSAQRLKLQEPQQYRTYGVHPDESGMGDYSPHPFAKLLTEIVDIQNGRIRDPDGSLLVGGLKGGSLANQKLLFAMNADGEMKLGRQAPSDDKVTFALDRLIHPNLFGGSYPHVMAAGEITFDGEGRIQSIFYNGTGHYQTPKSSFYPVERLFRRVPARAFALDFFFISNPHSYDYRRPASQRFPYRNDGWYLQEPGESGQSPPYRR